MTPDRCYVIAEIGINHNGSLDLAKLLIDQAKKAGADAVKFQKRTVEVVYTPDELARPRESPFGNTNGDLKRGLEFSVEQYEDLNRYCKKVGIDWGVSCWDGASVDQMAVLQPNFLKVASACLTDTSLLSHYYNTGIPTYLSTGMSTWEEIDEAVKIVEPACVLHCHSAYPSPLDELNLAVMESLKDRYSLPVGYSSHTVSPWPALMAAVRGAVVIEAHLTLDRSMFGSDQAASLEPPAFAKLVEEIRTWEKVRGDGIKKVCASEAAVKAKLRR